MNRIYDYDEKLAVDLEFDALVASLQDPPAGEEDEHDRWLRQGLTERMTLWERTRARLSAIRWRQG